MFLQDVEGPGVFAGVRVSGSLLRPEDDHHAHVAAGELGELPVLTRGKGKRARGPFVVELIEGNLAPIDHEYSGVAEREVGHDRGLRRNVRRQVGRCH